ncbi:MAG: Gldg family protein [Alphaproteobacteria bacterium]|nr:Gldg family protein [Alphaproteobacteria bacterium]
MFKFCSVVKNELMRYFSSSLAHVYLLAFLFLNASLTLYLGDFINRGIADLSVMFSFIPWIYLVFVSGIAMRLWSEEFKNKTVVQILSLPVSPTTLVWGKFTAAWIFCTIGLILTFPFVVTVNVLGNPDNGIISAGYFGCFILSGAMLAVAQPMSALTKNQVIALVLSVIANLLFFMSGLEYVLAFFRSVLPFNMVENIASLSFLSHFNDICNGMIGLRDILFYISIIILFNIITELIVRIKTSGVSPFIKTNKKSAYLCAVLVVWLGFAGFNMINTQLLDTYYLDVTQDKHFTLSETAKQILKNIKEPVTVKVYYSPLLSQRNPLFRQTADYLRRLLKTYQHQAPESFSYRFYYPQFLNEEEDLAIHDEMVQIPLPDVNQNAYFGISLVDEAGQHKTIPLIPLENQNNLSQQILQNIYELSHTKKTLGIITSLPVFGLQMSQHTIGTRWQIIDELEKLYHIKNIEKTEDFTNIDVLLMIHPQEMPDDLVNAVANYTLNGGKIVVLADIAAEATRLYSPVNRRLTPTQLHQLNLLWGFSFNPDTVIADLGNSITVNVGSGEHAVYSQDVIQFTSSGNQINHAQQETQHLSNLLFASASSIIPLEGHKSTFISLLKTGDNAALLSSDVVYENINPADILAQFKSDHTPKIVAAKIVSNIPQHPFEVIVIGDSDFAYDSFWSRFKMIDEHKYSVFVNDNANFLLNALDSLSGQNTLIPLRQSRPFIPRFDKWEALRKQNALETAIQERQIFDKINQVKTDLNNLWQKKDFENRQKFSDDELSVIADYRQNLKKLKQKLSDLRIHQNQNIEQKQVWVVFFNLYAVPLFLIVCFVCLSLICRQKPKYSPSKMPYFTKRVLMPFLLCFILFGCGLTLVLSSDQQNKTMEGQLVFTDWKRQLNQIQTITFERNGTSLSFYQKEGLWYIKGYEDYPVYQRRIINFLATLANMRYLEKKSARAEYLPKFGLDSSHLTTVTLGETDNKIIFQFDIGSYDEEIGRGGRGAFLKFPNRFQVWLVVADFISLSTDWRNWTLNTALNPRFGRVKSVSKKMPEDVLILLIKELQNTPLTLSREDPKVLLPVNDISLVFENDDQMTIYFEQKENKYYIRYTYEKPNNAYLRLFADYTKDKLYEIPAQNMENLSDIFSAIRQEND